MTDPNSFTDPGLHEPDSLDPRTMAVWGVALALLVVLSLLIIAGLMSLFERRAGTNGADVPASVDVITFNGTKAPSPTADQLAQVRAAQRRRLEEFDWVDREQKIVRVPIDRAMQLLLDRGLPVRKTPPESE